MRRGLTFALGLGLVLSAVVAAPVSANSLTPPCAFHATSLDANGNQLDDVVGNEPGTGGTETDPFKVDLKGSISYDGTTGNVIKDYTYQVVVFGAPVVFGTEDNAGGDLDGEGTVSVASLVTVPVTGTIFVSGGMKGEGGECQGSGWIRIVGDSTTSIPSILGYILFLLGLVMLYFSLPTLKPVATAVTSGGAASAVWEKDRHPFRGLFAGLLMGLGAALLSISFGLILAGALTPVVMIVAFLVIGLLVALFGPSRRRSSNA